MKMVDIIKCDEKGQEVWRYPGKVIQSRAGARLIEAYFDREVVNVAEMRLERGDRFIEAYFQERWYNIFEIHASQEDALKGWYCNVTTPAVFENSQVVFNDLGLDLLVFADGSQKILDEDEFALMDLGARQRQKARAALQALQELFLKRPNLDLVRDFQDL